MPQPDTSPLARTVTVLIVDDEPSVLDFLSRALNTRYRTLTATCAHDAEKLLNSESVQVVLSDHHMEGESGLSFLIRIGKIHPAIPCILITGDSAPALILDAINKGRLFQYLVKPVKPDILFETMDKALAYHAEAKRRLALDSENAALRKRELDRRDQFLRLASSATKLLGLSLTVLFLTVMACVILGMLGFLLLYFFKSALGIDLLPSKHLSDFF